MHTHQLLFVCLLSALHEMVVSFSDPDYRCDNNGACNIKSSLVQFTCCTQISCNGANKFSRITSGCVKQAHCTSATKWNAETEQFSGD